MLIPRVIPTLLIDDEVFVKTVAFADPTYVGDPVNVINLFNRFEVDEILLLDIRATAERRDPPYSLIHELASECWVPLTYGGGISAVDQARRVLSIGAEKVVVGTAVLDRPEVLGEIAAIYGAQAVVASVDARRQGGRMEAFVENGRRPSGRDPVEHARRAVEHGAGEILVNAIDRDGRMDGYDLDLVRAVSSAVAVPVIASGGAGSRLDLARPVRDAGAAAVAAGSLFVFQGRGRGVLINFPARQELEQLFA